MSVFHLPRLHFTGVATTQLPTGPRNGLVDLATNRPLAADGTPFRHDRPLTEYDGPVGDHVAANGHFVVDAVVSSVELDAGEADVADPVVGSQVDMWGHYNEYLQTTVNRARVFDVDPSSNWTTTLMVGQFGFGRVGRSHDNPYVLTGTVHGFQPPRWHDFRHGGCTVYQFVVARDELTWLNTASNSAAVDRLASTLWSGADGIVVQCALAAPATPWTPNAPKRWDLRGTIGPWHRGELRTYPSGRLLVPVEGELAPHVLAVEPAADGVTLNMIAAVGPSLPADDFQLRTAKTNRLVAAIPHESCTEAEASGGVVWVPAQSTAEDEALVLVSAHDGRVLSREREINLQVDDACLILEHPRHAEDGEHDVEVVFRSFLRGRPTPIENVQLRQVPNPRALPLAPDAARAEIVAMRCGDADADGVGHFTLRGVRAGSTRILLTVDEPEPPIPESLSYDNDDLLRFWSGTGYVSVRVLPDDWQLADLPDDEITHDTVFREVLAPYEVLYAFMREDVFSLADRCKVETYAKLIWQMCDPTNKVKTYYMPPTRDLTQPKAEMLLRYLRAQQQPERVLRVLPATCSVDRHISTRTELVSALRDAVTIELAVMLQYLYAAYSVPTHGVGLDYVHSGEWTHEQLTIACGDGGQTLDEGIRGTLIRVAREEMIHFLAVNNILQAIGEPFHVPDVDFGTINGKLPIPLDFSLERLNLGSVERFVRIEQPDCRVGDVRLGDRVGRPDFAEYRCASVSELYRDIRRGLQNIPDLFLVERGRGGGEHHLFLRESVNQRHPDYQLEVDDLASALFAVDLVTEQGEGGALTDSEDSHYAAFLGVAATLRHADWVPSYPTVRNPTLRRGDKTREYVPDPAARNVMALFNEAYSVMLQLMVQHFGSGPDTSLRRSQLMNATIDVMTGVLRPLGELLVTMPSGLRGRTAGPSFELDVPPTFVSRHDVAVRRVARRLDIMAARAAACPLVPGRVAEISMLLADQLRGG
ncbi:MAG TPA: ferritin-like domain-containing protein [Rugosimonospora sp.]|nr:ferritin-like domain-containing protein [Rugosimonospora sp.]